MFKECPIQESLTEGDTEMLDVDEGMPDRLLRVGIAFRTMHYHSVTLTLNVDFDLTVFQSLSLSTERLSIGGSLLFCVIRFVCCAMFAEQLLLFYATY